MSMLEVFFADLTRNPEDWTMRGVFADWHEDNGRPAQAECLRWMIRRRKRPYHGSSKVYTWFNADTIDPDLGDPESDLPGPVYKLLGGGEESANHKSFRTLQAAEEAFQAAWVAAREQGWDPGGSAG
jgi:uncharacterized protein (TIGR02996 family)